MDAKGFRLKQYNDFYNPNKWETVKESKKETKPSTTTPADDSRYPAYAGVMSDARTFTDYRSPCASRVTAGYAEPVRQWLINNGADIIDMNRRRQAENTGAVFGTTDTVPAPETLVFCDNYECKRESTNIAFGTGIETVNKCPELPGTFMYRPDPSVAQLNKKNIAYNTVNEKGRNSTRRWETAA